MPESTNVNLADFECPPVVETVLSLQFEKLTTMRAVHFGLFWHKVNEQFPKTEEQAPLLPTVERFPEPMPPGGQIRFESIEVPMLPRVWMINEAGTEVIQLQNDRFIKNWRKSAEDDPYPHYEPVIRPAFERDFRKFRSFLADQDLAEIKVTQCEVTYVNHIISGEGWDNFSELNRVFRFWIPPASPVPGNPEDIGIHMRFPIIEDGRPIGRLHVDVQPELRATDSRRMYVMNLTARGLHGSDLEFFDIGRRWIVKTFEQLTTEEMHRIWGKK